MCTCNSTFARMKLNWYENYWLPVIWKLYPYPSYIHINTSDEKCGDFLLYLWTNKQNIELKMLLPTEMGMKWNDIGRISKQLMAEEG